MTAPTTQLAPGTVVADRYEVLRLLGQGGMGQVVLVDDRRASEQRALKWVERHAIPSAAELRHLREYRILSRLAHPNVMRVHDYGVLEDAGMRFFTAEVLAGGALQDDLHQRSASETARVLTPLLRALAYFHHHDWVHGDIKPENFLYRLPRAGDEAVTDSLCLVDFGLAHRARRPAEEKILGTVYYMSPERILGARVDARTDLYAVGVLAHQLLTGRLPFDGATKRAILEGHVRGTPPPVRELAPEVSPLLEELVLGLLEKRPGDRPESALAVLEALHRITGWPTAPDTIETAQAFLEAPDLLGWEEPIGELVEAVENRLQVNVGWTPPDPFGGEAGDAARPLLGRRGGSVERGLRLLHSETFADLTTFQELFRREMHALGIPVLLLAPGVTTLSAESLRGLVIGHELKIPPPPTRALAPALVPWLTSLARERSFLVVIERFEEASVELCSLLEAVASQEPVVRALRGIAWVAFQLGAPGGAAAQWLKSPLAASWSEQHAVPHLGPEAMDCWLERRLGVGVASYALRQLLERCGQGSPVVMRQVLAELVDGGSVRRTWQGWSVAALPEGAMPVPSAALARQGRLGRAERQVLTTLALLGGAGDLDWISRLCGLPASDVLQGVRSLQDEGWIGRECAGRRLRFRSRLDELAVEQSLTPEVRRAVSSDVANLLLTRAEAGIRVEPQRLAHHLLEAGRVHEAVPCLLEAARRDAANGRPLAAIRWYERALDHQEALPDRAHVEVLDRLADLRQLWGPAGEVERLRRSAIEHSTRWADGAEFLPELLNKLAASEVHAGQFGAAVQRINETLRMLREDRGNACYRAALLLAMDLHVQRGTSEPLQEIEQALDALPRAAAAVLVGWEASLRAQHQVMQGRRALAIESLTLAEAQLEGAPTREAAAWCARLQAERRALRGDRPGAVRALRLAADLFRQLGDPPRTAQALAAAAELAASSGDEAATEGLLARAQGLVERAGLELERPRLAILRAQRLARSGWVSEARAQLAQVRAFAERSPRLPWTWESAVLEAEIELVRGHLAAARALLHGPAHARRAPHAATAAPWVRWGVLAARLALAEGEPGQALQVNLEALHETRERGDEAGSHRLWHDRLRWLERLGCTAQVEELSARLVALEQKQPALLAARGCVPRDGRELLRHGDELELADHYAQQAAVALGRGSTRRGLFLLEEAEFHAQRVRALPLAPLLGLRLAVLRDRLDARAADLEGIARRTWRTLTEQGVRAGRAEVLWWWAQIRAAHGVGRGCEQLLAASERELERWSARLPFPHDLARLRTWLGAGHPLPAPVLQE